MTANTFMKEIQEKIDAVERSLVSPLALRKRRTLQAHQAFFRASGVSIAVIHNGAVEWAKGYGTTAFEGGQPVNSDTLFQAASISKAVTALLVMRLVEEGILDLDEDVDTYLKTWKLPENEFIAQEKVTLHHLLCHTAGTTVHGFGGYALDAPVPSLQQVLDGEEPANSAAVRVVRKPGERHVYSGGGMTIAQLACMDASGKPFPDLMQEYVLGPLGMTHSVFDQPLSGQRQRNAARAHKQDRSQYPGGFHVYPELAAAGLWTTPSDLAKVLIEMQNCLRGEGTLLKTETAQEMIKPQIKERLKGINFSSWGIGFSLQQFPEKTYFGHSGGNAGFGCSMLGAVDQGEGAVVMTNSDAGSLLWVEIFNSIAEVYNWPGYDAKLNMGLKNLVFKAFFAFVDLKLRLMK